MKQINAEVIAVGTEILIGQINNTNAQWISKQLADNGINVFYHHVVGDNLGRVRSSFEKAQRDADLVLVTGGLGPTEDDLTREAFQLVSGLEMHEDKVSMDRIKEFFLKRGRTMSPNNHKQARVFEGAKVLENTVGMAPGMLVEHEGTVWAFMPGVPREMKQIMSDHVMPYVREKFDLQSVLQSRLLHFIGIGESQLETDLLDLIQAQENPTIATYASEGEVAVRLTARADSKQEADRLIDVVEKEVMERVGQYFYGYDETSVQQQVFELLKQRQFTLASAESLTGGLFADALVSLSGASEVFLGSFVAYSPLVKQQVLGVKEETIRKEGTVSEQCAIEMAENAVRLTGADIGISFTGVAGPDGSEGKEPGTVFISLHEKGKQTRTTELSIRSSRQGVRAQAVKKGFDLLFHYLK
ncbi:competence/damage-inducible protein A [Terribacillus sp. 7520-G]|uniref:competence/damage-inducible protein A n=1 Tax=unclassified Terribacillus TaxID=2636508 RepID=UPI000BA7658F|nr:competence/damage-inducible protein A [Terribacillus sp. 7520-G]PAD40128.1 competence/damage-inducible protein A [Terribacillus sp. 7520-G]